MRHEVVRDTWQHRRRLMYICVAFCMVVVLFVLVANRTSGAAETAVTMAFSCIIAIVGGYVFGAAWEDISITRTTGRPVNTIKEAGDDPDPGRIPQE